MKKSFHIGLIRDEQDIEELATEMRKYLKTLGEFCFCVGKDTNENRDSCAKSLFRGSTISELKKTEEALQKKDNWL